MILLLALIIPAKEGTQIYGFLLAGAFGLGAVFCWLAYIRQFGFIGRADEMGVSGYKIGGVSMKTVGWNEIERCEITTIHDALGRLVQTLFVFESRRKFVLLRILASATPSEKVEQFRSVVEYYLTASTEN